MLLLPVIIDLEAQDSFAVPKSALDAAVAYLLAALVSAYVVVGGRAALRWSPLAIPLVAYALVAGISTATAVHPATSLYGAPGRLLGLGWIVHGAVSAVAAMTFVRGTRDVAVIVGCALAGAVPVAGYGALQAARLDPVRWTDPLVGSTLGNPSALAGYLAIIIGLAGLAAHRLWEKLAVPLRIAVVAEVALAFAVLIFTSGRGPLLALPVIAIAIVVLAHRARAAADSRATRYALIASVAMAVAISLALPFTPAGDRLSRLVAGRDSGFVERAVIYDTSLRIVRERPLLGAGPDGLITDYLRARPPDAVLRSEVAPMQSSTHSWLLHVAVGSGVLGTIAFAGLVGLALARGWSLSRTRDAAASFGTILLFAYLVQGIANVDHVGLSWSLWAGIGLIAAADGRPLTASPPPPGRGAQRAGALAVGFAIVVAGIASMSAVDGVRASRAVKVSNSVRAIDPIRSEAAARAATTLDPRRADHWNVLGLARSGRDSARATEAFRRAADEAPYHTVYLLNVVREQVRVTRPTTESKKLALDYADRALRLDPHDPEVVAARGHALLFAGEPRAAATEADRAAATLPRIAYLILAGESWEAAGELDRSLERFHAAFTIANATGHPLWHAIRVRIATIYVRQGRYSEARDEIEAVLSANPSHPEALALMAQLERLGR